MAPPLSRSESDKKIEDLTAQLDNLTVQFEAFKAQTLAALESIYRR